MTKSIVVTEAYLNKRFTKIDSEWIDGVLWELYENKEWGDAVPAIALNTFKQYFTYTEESLRYTAEHIDSEYETFELK